MALYSWFLRTKTEQSNKTIKVNNNLIKTSESVKYIENYTMWPTAKIKQDVKVKLPSFNSLDNQSPKNTKVVLLTETALTAIKN